MKQITIKTHYWLYKKINDDYNYYFVRSISHGNDKAVWFIGYENANGSVSSVGGPITEDKQKELENEFKSQYI